MPDHERARGDLPEPDHERTSGDLPEQDKLAGSDFMKMMAPALFEYAILNEKDETNRTQIVRSFVYSPFTNWETMTQLLEYATYIATQKSLNAEIILVYAKKAMNTFLNERTKIVKNGISFQHLFEGKVVHTLGHVLNEGVTEWTGRKVMREYLKKEKPAWIEEKENIDEYLDEYLENDGAYFFEVKLAEMLMSPYWQRYGIKGVCWGDGGLVCHGKCLR